MPDWSKGRDQTKSSPWSSRLGVGQWAANPLPEKRNLLRKPKLELPLHPVGKQGTAFRIIPECQNNSGIQINIRMMRYDTFIIRAIRVFSGY